MKATAFSSVDKSEDQESMAVVPVRSVRRRNVSDPSSEVLETTDLLQQILAKLPAKMVFGFTLVSRYWNEVIIDPKLVCHLKVPRNPTAVFVRRSVMHNDNVKFTHIPLEGVAGGGGARIRRSTVSLNLLENENFTNVPFVIGHSGNGLMICSSCEPRCYFLYNPTTKKRERIPELKTSVVISMHISFQASGRHKIVAVYSTSDKLQLHVLEPNKSIPHWRNTGVDFPVLGLDVVNYGYGVDIDGVIYWPCYKSSSLMLFNVREETLQWLPEVPQPYNKFSGITYFGECKGNLRMVVNSSIIGPTFDMLELKPDHSMWFIKYHIDLTPRVRRTNWLPILVLALLPGEDQEEDDSYLIIHILTEVVSYNFKDASMRKLCDLCFRPTEYLYLRSEPWNYVHSYLQNPTYPRLTAS
ncbi:F-box domain-containing protein [Heracleum sosnowskyi]|uniref:F-box domain-containing protein n=1 Tax=Heracleum sosnowskyi TaxID=360622 RepID=A0AAD8HIA1_9APIA|nr:F-box domain-containing protein [Heracleum sosnowskyi]